MPDSERAAFLAYLRESLQERVGERLTSGFSDTQLDEFEALIDHDGERVAAWIDEDAPDFLSDPVYRQMIRESSDQQQSAETVYKYAATKWLEINRPDYRDIVR